MIRVSKVISQALSESVDDVYLQAIKEGRMEDVQALVNRAAHAAGYNVGPVYHASTYGTWTAFDPSKSAFGKAGYGSYFSDREGAGLFAEYGERFQMSQNWKGVPKNVRVIPVYLKMENPLHVPHVDMMKPHLDHGQAFGVGREYQKIQPPKLSRAQLAGHDGIITAETTAPKVHKTQGLKILHRGHPKGKEFPVYVIFSGEQAKSAEPITYNDAGEIIPLSQRFNPNTPDFRE